MNIFADKATKRGPNIISVAIRNFYKVLSVKWRLCVEKQIEEEDFLL